MKKQNYTHTIYNLFVGIIIFLVPTNFFLKFYETSAYVNGLQVDYLIPKLYLSDIFILSLLVVWFINWLSKITIKKKNWNKIVIILSVIFFLKQFLTSHPVSSVTYLLKIIELGLFSTFLIKNKKLINQKLITKSVLATLFFQSSIAIYQYIYQKSVFGYLLLGEPNLNNYINITKSSLFGVEKILPYGTTAHPNVLGGFLALYLLYIFNSVKCKHNLITILAVITLFLTQSASAITAFILGLIIIFIQKKWSKKHLNKIFSLRNITFIITSAIIISITSLNLLAKKYPKNQSIVRRDYLNTAAINMSRANFFTGVGLNNFTAKVEDFSPNKEVVRFVQPVHNIFLLFFAETGVLGIVTLTIILNIFTKKQSSRTVVPQLWIITLLPIALLDHYLLTLNTGILLIVFTSTHLKSKN